MTQLVFPVDRDLSTLTPARPKHPARFSDAIVDQLATIVRRGALVLDPFAGTGRVHELAQRCRARTVGIEIEPEWADLHPRTVVGDATALPFADASVDVVATSPTYGNRFADHHHARDGSVRRSYTHDLGRPLHPRNTGAMHWGDDYRRLHVGAWAEAVRVLRPDGLFVLNVSDHVRKGTVQPVTEWHLDVLGAFGLVLVERHEIPTPRLRFGANATARVAFETVAVLHKEGNAP